MLRTDGQDAKLFAVAGPVIHEITTSSLIEKGWLAKPRIKMVKCNAPRIGSPTKWAEYYRANILYNKTRTKITLELIANSIETNTKTLCLVAWDEHAKNLLSRISLDARRHIEYIKANFGKKRIRKAISRFASGEVRVLIATPLLSEGYDLCSIDRLIRAAAMKSFIKVTQETGRVLRIEDPPKVGVTTEVWDFYDNDGGGPLSHHSRERLEAWRQEKEFDVEVVDNWAQSSMKDLWELGYVQVDSKTASEGDEPSRNVRKIDW